MSIIKMMTIEIYPGEGFSTLNITDAVIEFLETTQVRDGLLTAYYKHSTGSIIIGEHETGIVADLESTLEKIAPEKGEYLHHQREVDYNGWAHVRAALMPTSVSIPIVNGSLALGTHQEIIVIDNQPEDLARYVLLQVLGNPD